MGLYEFHREGLIDTLESLASFMQNELITKMTADQQTDIAKLGAEYEAIAKKALTIPKDTAELMELRVYVVNTEDKIIPEMEDRLRKNMQHILSMMEISIYTPLEIKQNSIAVQWYLKMSTVFREHRDIIAEKTIEYQEFLRRRIETFNKDLEVFWEQVQDYENWGDIKKLTRYKKKAVVLDNKLIAAMDKIDLMNEEETAYGWELSQYPIRKQTHEKLMPYKKLFDAGQEFMNKYDLWMHSQVGSHDPDDIENDIGVIYRTVFKLEKQFGDRAITKQLATDVKITIDEFKTHMPIIQNLGNPGMKERHWEQISEIVGFPIKVSAELTLEKIVEFGLDDYIDKFESISESATKENNLEKAMLKMVVEWGDIAFVVNSYRYVEFIIIVRFGQTARVLLNDRQNYSVFV